MMTSCFAITGGCGYIGLRLANSLLENDEFCTVILLDIHLPLLENFKSKDRLIYRYCDIRSYESVSNALFDVTCVYHLASYGMSGREMLNRTMIDQVNIQGTKNLLDICRKNRIEKLIYCSTYNAVYTGEKELIYVTEDQCSYPNESNYFDHYSRTKSLAEQMILQANSSILNTVAIRPAAIYGDGELRHLPRILNLVRHGLAFFAIGHENILCDWIYADNLVYGLILAEKSLPKYSGEVYFLSDDNPVNNFQFLFQLIQGLGYEKCFYFYIPTWFMFYFGYAIEIVHNLIAKKIYNFSPFLTRAEVLKVGRTHYANISKAKRNLGYQVKIHPDEAMKRCVQWFDQNGYRKKKFDDKRNYWFFLFVVFIGLILIRIFLLK